MKLNKYFLKRSENKDNKNNDLDPRKFAVFFFNFVHVEHY